MAEPNAIVLNPRQLAVLSRFPIPSGDAKQTKSRQYESHFYKTSGFNVTSLSQATGSGDVILSLIEGVKQITPEFYDEEETTVALPLDGGRLIADSIRNWRLSNEESLERRASVKVDIALNELTEETKDYCSINDLWEEVLKTKALIEDSFSSIQGINLALEYDPEISEEWLSFSISLEGEVDDILDEYDNYVESFIDKVILSAQDKIRLSYNIL